MPEKSTVADKQPNNPYSFLSSTLGFFNPKKLFIYYLLAFSALTQRAAAKHGAPDDVLKTVFFSKATTSSLFYTETSSIVRPYSENCKLSIYAKNIQDRPQSGYLIKQSCYDAAAEIKPVPDHIREGKFVGDSFKDGKLFRSQSFPDSSRIDSTLDFQQGPDVIVETRKLYKP